MNERAIPEKMAFLCPAGKLATLPPMAGYATVTQEFHISTKQKKAPWIYSTRPTCRDDKI